MTDDAGCAPNPFGGFMTLAICKPLIRKHKEPGDWIAGFTSVHLNGDPVGKEKLVYLMKVADKISFAEYWNGSKYENRKDNIYKPITATNDYEQIRNRCHTERNKENDLSGKFVLISEKFYYFGSVPIDIPNDSRPKVPRGQSGHGVRTHDKEKVKKFISYIEQKYKQGVNNQPHSGFKDNVICK